MYSKHISSKYAQKVVRQLGVYVVSEEAVCLLSALLDTILLLTCEKAKDNPLDLLLVKRAIVNLFPPEFAKQILVHSTQASEAASTKVKLLADPVLANPNRINFHTLRPATQAAKSAELYEVRQLEVELRERCANFTTMGGKLIKTDRITYPKAFQRSAKELDIIDQIAVFLNEAMEFISRVILRAAAIEAQKALTPTIDDALLVEAGHDLNFALLFSLVSRDDFFILLLKTKSTSILPIKRTGTSCATFISDASSSCIDDTSSISTLLPNSPKSHKIFNTIQDFDSAIDFGYKKPLRSSSFDLDDTEKTCYPKTPYPETKADDPRCDYENYHAVEVVSGPVTPSFVILENSGKPLPYSERPPDFETLFASGKTVKLFISRAPRNLN